MGTAVVEQSRALVIAGGPQFEPRLGKTFYFSALIANKALEVRSAAIWTDSNNWTLGRRADVSNRLATLDPILKRQK